MWAASFNFVAAFLLGTAVAKTIGSGMIHIESVTQYVVIAGLLGAIVWDLLTWWWGLPTSSSHALIGGMPGAAIMRAGWHVIIRGGMVQDADFHRGGAGHGAGAGLYIHGGYLGSCGTRLRGALTRGSASCNFFPPRPTAWGTAEMTRRRPWGSSRARCMGRRY